MAAFSWLMQHLASSGGIEGVESAAAAAAYEVELEVVLSVVRTTFISAYCVIMMATNWSRATPLFALVEARL